MFAEAVPTAPAFVAPLLWLIPLPPILAFAIIALFTNRSRSATSAVAITGMALSWLMSAIVFFSVWQDKDLGKHPIGSQIDWLATGSSTLKIGTVVDPLGATFLFMVPLAATLIFIYSTGYMAHETRYTRFFAYLSLFAGSMMGLVVSDNLLTLFVFWELMGFCSYSLIGFFYYKESAYKAAVKAFMTTRIGDMLLILGMVYLYAMTGTLNFNEILRNEEVLKRLAETPAILGWGAGFGAEAHGAAAAAGHSADAAHSAAGAAGVALSAAGLIGILIFGGTVGKSAQWPLHVWLPDAMEGPTPVSAMIHAATMVSAGIFMTLRFFPLFQAAAGMIGAEAGAHHGGPSTALMVVGLIGAITAFMGATIAIAQYDIKRVMAFSTISQLGFMVAAIGIGAYIAAAFHLLTHAFFKALLFLGSGSVIHGVEHGHMHVTGHHHHGDPAKIYGKPVPGAGSHGHSAHDVHGHDAHGSHDGHGHDDHAHGHDDHGHAFDPQDLRNMGGLLRRMPITAVTYLIGCLALAGFPFITAGFWSKDEIFADAWKHGFVDGDWLGQLVFVVLVISAFLTAFYSMRQFAMAFLGKPRTEAAAHASENPASMTVPLVVLSIFALFIGFINIPKDFPFFGHALEVIGAQPYWLKDFLKGSLIVKPETLAFDPTPVWFSLGVAAAGLLLGWRVYGASPLSSGQTDPLEKFLGPGLHSFLADRWRWDELYRAIFIGPMQWVADVYSKIVDKTFLDGFLEGVYEMGGSIAGSFKGFDKSVVTGFSNWVGSVFKGAGAIGRELQTGQIQGYLLSGLGMILVIVAVFVLVFN
jgi:NADH-quinone oxidoreductase subunit L